MASCYFSLLKVCLEELFPSKMATMSLLFLWLKPHNALTEEGNPLTCGAVKILSSTEKSEKAGTPLKLTTNRGWVWVA